MSVRITILALLVAALALANCDRVWATDLPSVHQEVTNRPLSLLKRQVAQTISRNPQPFDHQDVDDFLNDNGPMAAERFLAQRSLDWHRAAGLALETLAWRAQTGVGRLEATNFPCDLFELGLIFESGHAHHKDSTGKYVAGEPVIWIRLGALGSVVKHLERFTPKRLVSYAYNTPRSAVSLAGGRRRQQRRRERRQNRRQQRAQAQGERQRLIRNYSVQEDTTIQHTLNAIAWWINDWAARNPDTRATLILDFEGTDFAFASWSMGEFLVKLDDRFPDLFDQIIGFRYKPKLWSLHTPISMFNRIFKTRFASSPETDRKLKFVANEPEIAAYVPRVDVRGYTVLPDHVSGYCPEPSLVAPAGCQSDPSATKGAYDPTFWEAIRNEFYQTCTPKARILAR